MKANDVIEAYVHEVAAQLPRRQRNDVAFELQALLHEELQGKADAAGREADAAMATELLRGFGRPGEVAARYLPTLTIIDPADGPRFLRAAVIGLVLIWVLGLWKQLLQPISSGDDLVRALAQWWGGTVIPSLWWPGVLVVGFGLGAWTRRRRSPTAEWKPRAGDRIHGGRVGLAMAVIGILCGLFVLLDPRRLLDLFWGGRAAAAAYEALTYSETFRERQGPWLLGLLLLHVPLFVAVAVRGRWSDNLRRLQTGLSLVVCAALAWTLSDGPVFVAAVSDRMVRFFLVLTIAGTFLEIGIRRYRSVRPTPNPQVQTQR